MKLETWGLATKSGVFIFESKEDCMSWHEKRKAEKDGRHAHASNNMCGWLFWTDETLSILNQANVWCVIEDTGQCVSPSVLTAAIVKAGVIKRRRADE